MLPHRTCAQLLCISESGSKLRCINTDCVCWTNGKTVICYTMIAYIYDSITTARSVGVMFKESCIRFQISNVKAAAGIPACESLEHLGKSMTLGNRVEVMKKVST